MSVDLQNLKMRLAFFHPFFSTLLAHFEFREDKDIQNIGTDGKRVFYNPKYFDSAPIEELTADICCVVLHVAFSHIERAEDRENDRWDAAAELVTHDIISHLDHMRLSSGALLNCHEFHGKSTEKVYDMLPPGLKLPSPSSGGTEGKTGKKGTTDDHSRWGEGEGNTTQEERNEAKEQWIRRLAEAETIAKMAGTMPGSLQEFIDGMLRPKLSWREILRPLIRSVLTRQYHDWSRPNRRYLWIPMIMPTMMGESVKAGIGLDTSGSMSDQDLHELVAEIKGICQQFGSYELHLSQCDAAIHNYTIITQETEIPTKVLGRGGTSFLPVFEQMNKIDVPVLIYMTDGYPNDGWPPEPYMPVIWLMTTDVKPPYGNVIRYERGR